MADLSVVNDDEPAGRRQTEIPGTERPNDPELDKIGVDYVKTRERRAELQDKEKKKKLDMAAKMKQLGVSSYEFFDGDIKRIIKLDQKETLTVSIADDE